MLDHKKYKQKTKTPTMLLKIVLHQAILMNAKIELEMDCIVLIPISHMFLTFLTVASKLGTTIVLQSMTTLIILMREHLCPKSKQ